MASIGQAVGSGLSASALASGSGVAGLAAMASPIGWAVAGLGILGSIGGASSKRKAAQERMGYIGQQQKSLEMALGQVGQIAEQKIDIAEDIHGERYEQASYGAGQSLYDITVQGGTAAQRSGLATSGTVQQMLERGQSGVRAGFGFEQRNLRSALGEKLMGIEEYRAGEEGRIMAEQQRLAYEMKKAKREASSGGFLTSLFGG